MKHRINLPTLCLGALLILSGCGSSGNQVAEGGISGTGITMGRISAFGSIIVNGIEFDTQGATFIRDNNPASSQNEYAVGEVVTIVGHVNADGKTGTAAQVSFSDILQGTVTVKPPLLATSIQVLGQNIHSTDLTVFHGFRALSDLNPGDNIEVSGFFDANDEIQASSITLLNTNITPLELKGRIQQLNPIDKTFAVNGVTVNYNNALILTDNGLLTNNQRVQISSQVLINNTLFANKVIPIAPLELTGEDEFEIEGIITSLDNTGDNLQFNLDNLHVVTTNNTLFKDGIASDLQPNVMVEAEGVINADGTLLAESIELQAVDNLPIIETHIDAIDYQAKTVQLFGKTIKVSPSTIFYDESTQKARPFDFSQFTVGEYADAKLKILPDGSLLALRLSREDPETDYTFKTIIDNIDRNTSSFTLFNIPMISNANTVYLDANELPITQAAFFSSVTQGVSTVEVEGKPSGNSIIITDAILVKP